MLSINDLAYLSILLLFHYLPVANLVQPFTKRMIVATFAYKRHRVQRITASSFLFQTGQEQHKKKKQKEKERKIVNLAGDAISCYTRKLVQ